MYRCCSPVCFVKQLRGKHKTEEESLQVVNKHVIFVFSNMKKCPEFLLRIYLVAKTKGNLVISEVVGFVLGTLSLSADVFHSFIIVKFPV